jgi:DNA polymerase III delta subunit
MPKPRLYLFHGNDSHASRADLKRWLQAFVTKYGETTQYILHADEYSLEELQQKLSQALATVSLFPEPKFIVVKRLTTTHTAARVKDVLKLVGSHLPALTDHVTLVFWEDKLVSTTHGMMIWFTEHVNASRAEVKAYKVVPGRSFVTSLLKEANVTFTDDARYWLDQHIVRLEREQRIESKIRSTEELVSDRRAWVMRSLIETAKLLAGDAPIDQVHLEQAAGVVQDPVSPFEIVNALQAGKWEQARRLAKRWEQTDEGAYFGLIALLRNHFKKMQAAYPLELLAEIEIMSKNVSARQAWLLDIFFTRCQFSATERKPLISPKRLWLSHVQRVD